MISLLLGLVALSSMNNDLPPVQYQGNAKPLVVITVTDPNTKEACGVAQKGYVILGCQRATKEGISLLWMPNPCIFPEAQWQGSYAHLMCHEMGHAQGWGGDHPDK